MADHVGKLRANALFGVGAAFDMHAGTAPAGAALDAAQRAGVGLPAGPGAAAAVASLPAEQPGLRAEHPGPPAAAGPDHARTVRHGRVRHHSGSTAMSVTDRAIGRPADLGDRRRRRGEAGRGDPRRARRAGRARPAAVHAGDAAVLRPALRRGQDRVQDVRHRHLDGPAADDGHGASGGCPLRRSGTRRLPGGLPDLLEDRLAHPRLRAERRTVRGRRAAAAARAGRTTPDQRRAVRRTATASSGAPAAPGNGSPRWPCGACRPRDAGRVGPARVLVPGHRADPRGTGRHPVLGPDGSTCRTSAPATLPPAGRPGHRDRGVQPRCRT